MFLYLKNCVSSKTTQTQTGQKCVLSLENILSLPLSCLHSALVQMLSSFISHTQSGEREESQ